MIAGRQVQQLVALLDQWVGSEVAVRVVSADDQLLAVFRGQLRQRSKGKDPALFWPLEVPGGSRRAEEPGVYLHPQRFQGGWVHEGEFVLELRQDDVTLNIRRL